MRPMRTRTIAVLVALPLAFAACGGDDEGDGGGGGGSAATTVEMTATEFKFDPANPSVDEPGVVRFNVKNDGNAPHALEVEGPQGEVETEEIAPGQSASVEADLSEEGSFTIYCPVGNHRQQGMEGKVTVGGGGASSGGSSDSSGGGGY